MGIFADKGRTPPTQAQPTQAAPATVARQPQPAQARPPLFGGFGGTKSRSTGAWLNKGVYILEIAKTVGIVSSKPDTKGHEKFILEATVRAVVTSFETEFEPGTNKVRFAASNKVGERVTWVQNVTRNATAMGNIKSLFLAIAQSETPGLNESDVTEEEWDAAIQAAVSPPNDACAGTLIIAHAIGWEGKHGWITVVNFLPYNPTLPADRQTTATRDIADAPPSDDIPF